MCKLKILFCALAALAVTAPVSAGDGSRPNDSVDVLMQCNTMVGAFEVDPVAARAALPASI